MSQPASLDPDADETLRVIKYFDALMSVGTSVDGYLRAAAVMADAVAGADRGGRISRFTPDGRKAPADETPHGSVVRPIEDGSVWLERTGAAHRNDEIVVDRLAFAVGFLDARNDPSSGLALIVDAGRSVDERAAGLSRLHLDPAGRIRVIATDLGKAASGISAAVPTRYGILQASLDLNGSVEPSGPAGIGIWTRADHAPESWEGAVFAHRLSVPETPVVNADDLGAMVILARAYDPDTPHPDVEALTRLDARSAEVLNTLVTAISIRSAATDLAMHHSTLQAKHEMLSRDLGYDPRSTAGRMRYMAAEFLRRLGTD